MFNYPGAGAQDLSAYSLPGIPWVTGSTVSSITLYTFPCATNFVTVKNTTTNTTVAVGFTLNGLNPVTRKYFTVAGGAEEKLEVRVAQLFLSASSGAPVVEVIAGLSTCPFKSFPVLTASFTDADGTYTSPMMSGVG